MHTESVFWRNNDVLSPSQLAVDLDSDELQDPSDTFIDDFDLHRSFSEDLSSYIERVENARSARSLAIETLKGTPEGYYLGSVDSAGALKLEALALRGERSFLQRESKRKIEVCLGRHGHGNICDGDRQGAKKMLSKLRKQRRKLRGRS